MGPIGPDVYSDRVNSSLLRPWTRVTTWWSLVHVLTGLAVGYVTTVFVAVAVIVSVSTIIVVPVAMIGVYVTFVVGRWFAQIERSRFAAFEDVDLTDTTELLPGRSWWTRYSKRMRSATRWRELLYLLLRLPVSVVQVFVLTVVWSGSVALAFLPLYVGRLPDGRAELAGFTIESGAPALLACVVGIAAFVQLAPWVTVGLGEVDVAFGRSLLAHGSKTEIEQQVTRLESSRVAAVDSAEAERRRIERDLHDGAQQRLIAAAMDLGVARDRLVSDPPAGQALVASAHEEVKAALRELRDLVRGIHPVILEDRGLDAALSAVVARSTVPVSLSVDVEPRPSATVESAAYFIVCEALANVARHSGAASASVTIARSHDRLHIEVCDDGHGGADPARGTGLRGLADRVAALGGTISLASPVGGPTRLIVEVPCAS